MTNLYKVKRGDTLSAIAKAHGTTVTKLASLNNIADVNMIVEGQFLELPSTRKDVGDVLKDCLDDIGKLESVKTLIKML